MILTQEGMGRIGLQYIVSLFKPNILCTTHSIRAVEDLVLVLIVNDFAGSGR